MGANYKLTGVKNLRETSGIVIINHQSFLDLIVLSHLWVRLGPVAVIAKKETLYFPPIGITLWSFGSVFIDRSNSTAAHRSIERASEAIHRDGKKLIIFPEGTRSISDQLLPFKNGAFVQAFSNKCKVYPIVVSKCSYFDHDKKIFNPGTDLISILEPVDATKFEEFRELREFCQNNMQKEYDRINALKKEILW